MKQCKNCGTEFSAEFLQCPNCGSNKIGTKDKEVNDGFVGTLVTLLVVGILCSIIGLGIYYVLHPVTDGDAMSDLPDNVKTSSTTSTTTTAITTSTTTTAITTSTTTTAITTSTTTTTGVLNKDNPGGGDHGGGANMVTTTSSIKTTQNIGE